MSYNSDFERDFMERSLILIKEYKGAFDATILLNCLLGLLIVPKESCLKAIPLDPIEEISKWGISRESIKELGNSKEKDDNPNTLRGIVWHLRNAVAHFRFRPVPESGEVVAFHFHDKSGFEAEIPLTELRVFVEKLAIKLKEM